jgi:hypothetical protein
MYSFDLLNHLILYKEDIPVFISTSNHQYSIHKLTYSYECIMIYVDTNIQTLTVKELITLLEKDENRPVYATGKYTWFDIEKITLEKEGVLLHYILPIKNSNI